MEQIDRVFWTVSRDLPKAGVEFLMIGGHAVNHYGYTRATLDVDFMIAAEKVSVVRQVMKDAGFTNISEGETVIFFSLPDSVVRVDFLPVDSGTLSELLSRAVRVEYGNVPLKVPALKDLLAMKLFALKGGHPRRKDRDMADVVHLVAENKLTAETDLKPLCERFATDRIFQELSEKIKEMKNAQVP
jgi:predicted nucleotidyltransferase